jgi:hypothetical protein
VGGGENDIAKHHFILKFESDFLDFINARNNNCKIFFYIWVSLVANKLSDIIFGLMLANQLCDVLLCIWLRAHSCLCDWLSLRANQFVIRIWFGLRDNQLY